MPPDVPSPRLATTPFQGRDSQARRATARVIAAPFGNEGVTVDIRPPAPAARPPSAPPASGHWLRLQACRVAGHVLPLVLLHPRHGIAIAGGPADAVALVRQRLDRARFPAIFPGALPILRLSGPDSPAERAFATLPPLSLPGGDAWVAMARLALETEASPAMPARVGIRARRRRQRHRLLLAGGLAFLLLGGSGLGLALLTPATDPASVLATRTAPTSSAPVAGPATSAPVAGPATSAPVAVPATLAPVTGPATLGPVTVPAPPAAITAGPPLVLPRLPVDRPDLSPAVPAPPAPPVIAPPVAPSGLATMRAAPAPLPPLPDPEPPRVAAAAPPEARPPEARQAEARPAEALPLPPALPHRADPDPSPMRRPAPAVQEARNLPPPISTQSIAGAQRCRLITQRIQIGDQVADADIRFLQRGCPD